MTDRVDRLAARELVVNENPQARNPQLSGSRADLSPSGTLVATEKDDTTPVYDARTGKSLGTVRSVEGHQDVIIIQWLDDDRFTAIGGPEPDENAPIDLLTCSVASGNCEVSVRDLAKLTDWRMSDTQLPSGFPY